MKTDVPLGRIFGIKVGFSWSVILVAALYVYILAQYEFPNQVLGMSSSDYWIAGVVGALLFFLCLLAHELGHALMAKRAGIGVYGITLWLLGGVAEMESEAPTAGKQFGIAAAGPLTNAALAGLFWLGHSALSTSSEVFSAPTGVRGLAAVLFAWLAFINLLLAAFNLLPAAPLDGGHLLSAGLWAATGNATTGRLWAARSGMALGGGLAVFGLLLTMQGRGTNGIWLAVVGYWIAGAARRDIAQAQVERRFDSITLGQIMRANPTIIPASLTIDQLIPRIAVDDPNGAFPVQGVDGRIVGLLTMSQLVHTDAAMRATVPVGELAFPLDRLTLATTEDDALPAVRKMSGTGVPQLLVLHPNGRVAGVVSAAQVNAVLDGRHRPVAAAH